MKAKKNSQPKPSNNRAYNASDLVAHLRNEVEKQIAEQTADLRNGIAKRADKIRQTVDAVNLLNASGWNIHIARWDREDITVKVDKSELVKVYEAIGPIKMSHKSLVDARSRKVAVYLTSVNYPAVTIRYETKMPKGEKAKCRIVRTRSSYSRLVCSL